MTAPSTKQPIRPVHYQSNENVLQRLRRLIQQAKAMGLKVRQEYLEDEQASWCEIQGVRTVFINLSQTAAEQIVQLEETLDSITQTRAQNELEARKVA